jgi:hypothetical protein
MMLFIMQFSSAFRLALLQQNSETQLDIKFCGARRKTGVHQAGND